MRAEEGEIETLLEEAPEDRGGITAPVLERVETEALQAWDLGEDSAEAEGQCVAEVAAGKDDSRNEVQITNSRHIRDSLGLGIRGGQRCDPRPCRRPRISIAASFTVRQDNCENV